jgi:60 kDa SS-A/Ro ribonucleoprotein
MVSDNESWLDSQGRHAHPYSRRKGTTTFNEFVKFQKRNPGAKMVCLDLHPGRTSQAPDAPGSVMNIGGFSDEVFNVISRFYRGEHDSNVDAWVKEIRSIRI